MKVFFATGEFIELPFDSLIGANLDGLNLHRVLLEEHDMRNASFVGADLRGAQMWKSNLTKANLDKASLITADLRYGKFLNASFKSSRAIGCQFDGSNLYEADFEDADIGHASFVKSNLSGAKLQCLRIELASFKEAVFDSRTLWPSGFNPIQAGALFKALPYTHQSL